MPSERLGRRLRGRRGAVAAGVLCAATAAAMLPVGSASAAKGKPPLYILAVVALSGSFAHYGQVDIQGMQAQVNLVNKKGGVDGRKIKIITRNDTSTAAKAVLAAKTILTAVPRQDVLFCYPGAVGVDTVATLAVFTATKCLTLSPAATETGPHGDETSTRYPYAFWNYPDQTEQSRPQIAGIKQLAGPTKKVGIMVGTDLGDQADVGPDTAEIKKLGLDLVDTATVPLTGTTFTSQLATAKQDGVTALYLKIDTPSAAVTVMKGVASLGWKNVKVEAGPTSANATVLEGMPASVRSQFYALGEAAYVEGFKKGTKTFQALRKAIAAVGTVTDLGISSNEADGVNIGIWAYEKAHSTTATKERRVLDSLGKKDLPKGVLRVVPQPHYTKKHQGLQNATFKDFWGLLRAGTPVTDQWPGQLLKLTKTLAKG